MASADDKSYDDINVTPMVDLYLVLLLIFIIMTTAGVQGVKVNLPSASSKPAAQKLDGRRPRPSPSTPRARSASTPCPSPSPSWKAKLAALKAATPELPVVVRGDRQSQYQGVMDVLDVLGRVGITQIGLATQPTK